MLKVPLHYEYYDEGYECVYEYGTSTGGIYLEELCFEYNKLAELYKNSLEEKENGNETRI